MAHVPTRLPPPLAALHGCAFMAGSLLLVGALNIVLGLYVAFVTLGADDPFPDATQLIQETLGAAGLGLISAVQIGCILSVTLALAAVLPAAPAEGQPVGLATVPQGWAELREKLGGTYAFAAVGWGVLAATVLVGLTVGVLPGWIAQELRALLPGYSGSLELVTQLMTEAAPLGRMVLIASVVVSAPLAEELIFRGYLWDVMARALHPGAALAITTVLFALYHMDPVHTASVLPIALVLGMLRWITGSIVPCILAHFANNTLATVLTVVYGPDAEGDAPLWGGLVSFAVCLIALGAVAALIRRRR